MREREHANVSFELFGTEKPMGAARCVFWLFFGNVPILA